MNKSTFVLVGVLLILIAVFGVLFFLKNTIKTSVALKNNYDPNEVIIKAEYGGGATLNSPWHEVKIFGNGKLVRIAMAGNRVTSSSESWLTQTELDNLVRMVTTNGFMDLSDEKVLTVGGTTMIISVNLANSAKIVTVYNDAGPSPFREVFNEIFRLAGVSSN